MTQEQPSRTFHRVFHQATIAEDKKAGHLLAPGTRIVTSAWFDGTIVLIEQVTQKRTSPSVDWSSAAEIQRHIVTTSAECHAIREAIHHHDQLIEPLADPLTSE